MSEATHDDYGRALTHRVDAPGSIARFRQEHPRLIDRLNGLAWDMRGDLPDWQ